jgi:hypothetical protein
LPFLIIPLRGISVTDLGVSTTPAAMDESLHIIGGAGQIVFSVCLSRRWSYPGGCDVGKQPKCDSTEPSLAFFTCRSKSRTFQAVAGV